MKTITFMFFSIFIFAASAFSQQILVPVSVEYSFLLKLPMFINNFSLKQSDCLTVGVIYQSKFKISAEAGNAFNESASKNTQKTFQDKHLKCKLIDLNENSDYSDKIKDCDIIYIAPLKAVSINEISRAAANLKILTVTGVVEYIDNGIVTGFDLMDNKPKIIINNTWAKNSDIKFSAELMKLAKIHD